MSHDYEPDASEKRIRFGCGFIFGGMVGFLVVAREIQEVTGTFWAAVICIALLSGYLALRYGDEFWEWVGKGRWF
jgi:hypothetical protein